jgi:hypothetical protein
VSWTLLVLLVDSDVEVSKVKPSTVTEELESTKLSDVETESVPDDIEVIEKPERSDIEKKLE